jgi:hypothetical protein
MDSVPLKYQNLASGAKAQVVGGLTQGLKPLPPKEAARVGRKGSTVISLG